MRIVSTVAVRSGYNLITLEASPWWRLFNAQPTMFKVVGHTNRWRTYPTWQRPTPELQRELVTLDVKPNMKDWSKDAYTQFMVTRGFPHTPLEIEPD